MKLKCPKCKTETVYSEDNPFRPFCSQRCQDADFIDWSDGKYAIPGQQVDPDVQSDTENDSNNDIDTQMDPTATKPYNKSNLH